MPTPGEHPKDLRKEIADRRIRLQLAQAEASKLTQELSVLTGAAELLGVSTLTTEDFEMDEDHLPGIPPPPPPKGVIPQYLERIRNYGFVKDAFKKSLTLVPKERFSVNDVAEQILKIIPDFNLESNKANLSAYLKEFSDDKTIELIEPGRGRLPAYYRIKK